MFDAIAESILPSVIAAVNLSEQTDVSGTTSFQDLSSPGMLFDANSTTTQPQGMNRDFYFIIIPNVWAIISNLMVIFTMMRTSSIIRSFAYVVTSLSLVDLCSSLLVIPFGIYLFANLRFWNLGRPLCILWTAADVMLCTASICHHCAIALHRYLLISNPHAFSVTSKHKIIYRLIVPAWCISAFISLILVIRAIFDTDLVYSTNHKTCGINDRSYAIYSSIVSFFIPLSIIFVVSLRSILILQKRIEYKRKSHLDQKRRRSTYSWATPMVKEPERKRFSLFSRSRFSLSHGTKTETVKAKRIIFPSRSKSDGKKQKEASIYKALETFTRGTLSVVATDDNRINSVVVDIGPNFKVKRKQTFREMFQGAEEKTMGAIPGSIPLIIQSPTTSQHASASPNTSTPIPEISINSKFSIDDYLPFSADDSRLSDENTRHIEFVSMVSEPVKEETAPSFYLKKAETSNCISSINNDKVNNIPTSTSLPCSFAGFFNIPSIDSSSKDSDSVHTLRSPMKITEMTPPEMTFYDSSTSYSIVPSPPPVVREIRNSSSAVPVVHMNSLEKFESPLVSRSPKTNRQLVSTAALDLTLRKEIVTRVSYPQRAWMGVESQSHQYRRYSEDRNPIGGSMVPASFIEMVKTKDHQRQVALIKRGKTFHTVNRSSTIGRKRSTHRQLSGKRSFSMTKSPSQDIAMQTLARRIKKERQAGHTLIVVLTCFVFMWAPFFFLNFSYGICGDCVNTDLHAFFSWIGWASCGVNPVIYTLFLRVTKLRQCLRGR